MSLRSFFTTLSGSGNIHLPDWQPKSWVSSAVDASLKQLVSYAESNANAAISWYYEKKLFKAWTSRVLRLLTILAAALGALIPLMVSTGWFAKGTADDALRSLQLNQYGYLCIGLAAFFLALDRFSASSTSWMRYVTTAMALQTEVEKFRFDWERLTAPLAGRTPDGEILLSLLKRVTDFSVAVRALVENETKAWVGEFQTNLAELQKQSEAAWESARAQSLEAQKEVAAQRQALRPGAIDLLVENAPDTDEGYDVLLDGDVAKTKVTSKSCGVLGVPPGLHDLSTTATLNGIPVHASQVVDVVAGAATKVQLKLERRKAPAKAA